jgi:hypothetical protein
MNNINGYNMNKDTGNDEIDINECDDVDGDNLMIMHTHVCVCVLVCIE